MSIMLELDFGDRRSARGRFSDEYELVVDNFAGGGGASLGIEKALGRAVDIAINHDKLAVDTHATNHPATRHLCEDVWQGDPIEATRGRPVGLAWFSPDCKHFSRAKGGKPVEKKIRGLAWVVVRWAKLVRPRVIILENVREFEQWGPLTDDSMPCPKRKGLTFRRWIGRLRGLGYKVEWKVLNAADFGAPTHRRRLFLVARCDGDSIAWPKPTHGPGQKHPWRTAAECIDWSIPCPSIFLSKAEGRAIGVNRPLAEKTMRRIAMGLKRYVLDNPNPFIVRVNHGGGDFRGQGLDEPLGTVTSRHGQALVSPYLVQRNGEAPHQETRGQEVDRPLNTVTPREGGGFNAISPYMVRIGNYGGNGAYTTDAREPLRTIVSENQDLVVMPSLVHYHGEKAGEVRASDVGDPLPVQDTENRFGLVAAFVNQHFGGMDGKPADVPLPTVTAIDHNSLTVASLMKFRGDSAGSPADAPCPTITGGGDCVRPAGAAHALGLMASNLVHFNHGDKQWSACDEPLRTVTTGGNHAAVVAVGQYISEPLHTITGKDRFAVVQVAGLSYAIADIGMRMLRPRELARAQGFPDDYILKGSNALQVKLIGNSVAPVMGEVMVRANVRIRKVVTR
jgi:DNA (cytosine-5)-methyltransferase 1